MGLSIRAVWNPYSRTDIGDALANGLVNQGIAHDAALAHLAFPGLKLRFDQYNHLPIGL